MNVLAMKGPGGTRGIAQLWIIGKLAYITLAVNHYPTFIVEFCLTNDNRTTLCMMLKKWGNLGENWDPSRFGSVFNISTRPEKVQELIDFITSDEEMGDVIQAIHYQDTFLFTYDAHEAAGVKSDYPDPGHDVGDFKAGAKAAKLQGI